MNTILHVLELFERKKNEKKYSPNFKVVFGRFVVEDRKKKKVSSNVGVVSEQDLVAWPTASGSHIRVGISNGCLRSRPDMAQGI